jgi:hypothetical protein
MKKTIILIAYMVIGGMLILPAMVSAQESGILSIPASALLPRDNTLAYDTNGVRMAFPTNIAGNQVFQAPVFLPHCAIIKVVTLEAMDSSGGEFGGFVRSVLRSYRFNSFSNIATVQTTSFDAPGDTRVTISDLNHLVENDEFSYGIEVTINLGNGGPNSEWFYKVIIQYDLSDCNGLADCEGDFDIDGDVDSRDLWVFVADFGRVDCP